jgi:hypothetical protein
VDFPPFSPRVWQLAAREEKEKCENGHTPLEIGGIFVPFIAHAAIASDPQSGPA